MCLRSISEDLWPSPGPQVWWVEHGETRRFEPYENIQGAGGSNPKGLFWLAQEVGNGGGFLAEDFGDKCGSSVLGYNSKGHKYIYICFVDVLILNIYSRYQYYT